MVTDYAQLAKRISAVTTNCLLTAVVLVAGLGLGRQVLRWWAEDPRQSAGASRPATIAEGLGDPSRLHVLQFGERPWSLRRQSIAGNRQAAAAALREICGEVVRQDRLPDGQPGEAEDRFLGRLEALDPAEGEPGKWRLYKLDEAFPMVVGTQPRAALDSSPSDSSSKFAVLRTRVAGVERSEPPETRGTGGSLRSTPATPPSNLGLLNESLSAAGHRVVVWGLALPVGPEAWTLFTFQPEVPAGRRSAALPEVPIPGKCRRTVSMRVSGGGGILAFEGPPEPKTWIRFYDRWSAAHNWKTAGGWRQFGRKWHVRYSAPGEGPNGRWEVDVHVGNHDPGRGTGLLLMTPCPRQRGPE